MKRVLIINGPNLNLLGKREPLLYGSESFDKILKSIQKIYPEADISHLQSNSEDEIIQALHNASKYKGIALNAGAFTHTSLAIADAVASIETPVVEVHITNIFGREHFRRHSAISKYAAGMISGFGTESYRLAVDYLLRL